MNVEENDPVSVPTNQPLLPNEIEVETECEINEEEEEPNLPEKETFSSKNDKESSQTPPSNIPSNKPKHATTAALSTAPSVSGGRNNKINQNEHNMAKSQSEIQVSVSNSLSVSQTSKNSLMTFSSSGTFYDHATSSKKKVDLRITPKQVSHSNGKDATDFRQMEQGLLQLLEDFHSGKLEAFGQDCTFEKMENVREQQEKLARLHFDLNSQQELCGHHTNEGIDMSKKNLAKLTENLQELSRSIEKLQSGSPVNQGDA